MVTNIKTNVIGISGFAGAGKNLYASLAKNIIKTKYNINSYEFAFANILKSDLNNFISPKLADILKINFFTNNQELKNIIRPIMVEYGMLMRNLTNGTYWIKKLEHEIDSIINKNDIIFITDVRYENEMEWIQKKYNGKIIFINRILQNGNKNNAANFTEKKYTTNIQKLSNYYIEWETDIYPYKNLYDIVNKSILNLILEIKY